MITLSHIIDSINEFAEATRDAFKLDVMFVDENKKVVAGTGTLKGRVGDEIIESGIINNEIFINKKCDFIITDTFTDPNCLKCDRYQNNCMYKNVVATGIYVNNVLKGVICVNAFTEDQIAFMANNEKNILNFTKRISNLISSRLLEEKYIEELKINTSFLDSIYNKINKGVIVTDLNNNIIKFNNFIIKMLDLDDEELLNRSINSIFPNISLNNSSTSYHNEVSIKINGKINYLLYTTTPIIIDNNDEAIVYFFEDTNTINEITHIKKGEIVLDDIIGESTQINEFKKIIKRVSKTSSTVLLYGETGTGKELFARAIHSESSRRGEPFKAINCGAIPEALIESELFGYEKGAFTGAERKGKHGKFYLADKGTVFLDEVENMPLYLQQKLLRVIETREIERIGSSECIPIDIRIVAATNINLLELVKRGEFREDLYHRLNVIGLHIPPLREREGDVLVLTNYFINKFNERYNKNILGINDEVKNLFLKYDWRGNVRELQNAIEYAINIEISDYIDIENLPQNIRQSYSTQNLHGIEKETDGFDKLDVVEKKYIQKALNFYGRTDNGIVESAKALGISRSTIYRKIAKYSL
jgi:transcriptional regulator with PAS, ATPase and Fis domain